MEKCELAEQYGTDTIWPATTYICKAPKCEYNNRNEKTKMCRTQGRKPEEKLEITVKKEVI